MNCHPTKCGTCGGDATLHLDDDVVYCRACVDKLYELVDALAHANDAVTVAKHALQTHLRKTAVGKQLLNAHLSYTRLGVDRDE